MKLWLDDVRRPPSDDWHWVRTAEEAIAWLVTDAVAEASLDHDLGPGVLNSPCHTGMDVLDWLERFPAYWPPAGVHVHSCNPSAAARMRAVIARHAHGLAHEN